MKPSTIFILIILFTLRANAQKIEVLNKSYGSYGSGINLSKTAMNLSFGVFDSVQYGNFKVKVNANQYFNLLAVCDTNGNLNKKYSLSGLNQVFFENTDDVILYSSALTKVYIDNVQVLDSINKNYYRESFMRLNLLTGTYSLIKNFNVNLASNPVIAYDQVGSSIYVMFSRIVKIDSTLYDTSVFEKSKTSILRMDFNGTILQKWKVDSVFTNFSLSNNKFYLSASVSDLNTSYKLNNSLYTRNETSDKFLTDNIYGIYDLTQKRYSGTTVIKSKSASFETLAVYPNFITSFRFTDSIVVNKQTVKIASDFQYKTAVASINDDGTLKWYKYANSILFLENLRIDNGKINFSFTTTQYSNFKWDGVTLQNIAYGNRLFINAAGAYVKHYPIPNNTSFRFNPSYLSAKENISYINYFYDSVVVNGTTYKAPVKNRSQLLIRYNADTSKVNALFERTHTNNYITVYPNPTHDKITILLPDNNVAEMLNVHIYNITGNEVFKQAHFSSAHEIDLSSLPGGLYFIEVEAGLKRHFGRCIKL